MISSAASKRLELKGTVINELSEYNNLNKLFNIGLFIPYFNRNYVGKETIKPTLTFAASLLVSLSW